MDDDNTLICEDITCDVVPHYAASVGLDADVYHSVSEWDALTFYHTTVMNATNHELMKSKMLSRLMASHSENPVETEAMRMRMMDRFMEYTAHRRNLTYSVRNLIYAIIQRIDNRDYTDQRLYIHTRNTLREMLNTLDVPRIKSTTLTPSFEFHGCDNAYIGVYKKEQSFIGWITAYLVGSLVYEVIHVRSVADCVLGLLRDAYFKYPTPYTDYMIV